MSEPYQQPNHFRIPPAINANARTMMIGPKSLFSNFTFRAVRELIFSPLMVFLPKMFLLSNDEETLFILFILYYI